MGIYFRLLSSVNGEIVINGIKIIYIGNIWDKILKRTGALKKDESMVIDKEYHIDISEFSEIIKYYEDVVNRNPLSSMSVVINTEIIEPLKQQLDYRISEHKDYKIVLF